MPTSIGRHSSEVELPATREYATAENGEPEDMADDSTKGQDDDDDDDEGQGPVIAALTSQR